LLCISRHNGCMSMPSATSFNSPSGTILCRSMQGVSFCEQMLGIIRWQS
jgi:hypothetical protein